jgi:hypothetical protein
MRQSLVELPRAEQATQGGDPLRAFELERRQVLVEDEQGAGRQVQDFLDRGIVFAPGVEQSAGHQ